jgi:hypothetical protein
MGALATYCVFLMSTICGPVFPYLGILGYVWFVSVTPQFLWRFSLLDPFFDFQKYIAISTIIGFCLTGFRGSKLSGCAFYAIFSFTGYWILSFMSSFSSVEPDRSWFFVEQFSKIAVMSILLTKLLDTQKRIETMVWCVLGGIGWNAFEINRDYYSRGMSTVNQDGWAMQNANGFSLLLVMVALISLSMFISSRNAYKKVVLFLVSICCVHAIYIVESRGGMLGLIAGGMIIVLFQEKTFNNVLGFCVAGAIAVILAGPPVIKEFFSSFERDESLDASASDRLIIWKGGVRLTAENPMLGVGPWAAELPLVQYAGETGVAKYKGRVALHNLPLEVSTGSGLPALLCYLVFFFLPVHALAKQLRSLRGSSNYGLTCGLVAAIPAYWVSSFFNSGALLELPYLITAIGVSLLAVNDQFLENHSKLASDCNEANDLSSSDVEHSVV